MNKLCRIVFAGLLSLLTIGLAAAGDDREKALAEETTAQIELLVGPGKTRLVTVALGQTAKDVLNRCKPAKVYADDDPWLGYAAAKGGSYVLMFAAEGTVSDMRGRPDPGRDKLYAVMQYPTESPKDGKFLLPAALRDTTCGDIVTLKVLLAPDKARVATVALGLSTKDVERLFTPATDQAKAADVVLFDSIHDGDRYLLVFSPPDGNDAHEPKRDKLSQVMYCPGEKPESIFLLPREKRGEPLPANYKTLLENTGN